MSDDFGANETDRLAREAGEQAVRDAIDRRPVEHHPPQPDPHYVSHPPIEQSAMDVDGGTTFGEIFVAIRDWFVDLFRRDDPAPPTPEANQPPEPAATLETPKDLPPPDHVDSLKVVEDLEIRVKPGVDASHLKKEIVDILPVVKEVFDSNGVVMTITSTRDSKHGVDSKHYQDRAIDIRANHISDELQDKINREIQAKVGKDYDSVSEHPVNDPASDHIHLEYDPKR